VSLLFFFFEDFSGVAVVSGQGGKGGGVGGDKVPDFVGDVVVVTGQDGGAKGGVCKKIFAKVGERAVKS